MSFTHSPSAWKPEPLSRRHALMGKAAPCSMFHADIDVYGCTACMHVPPPPRGKVHLCSWTLQQDNFKPSYNLPPHAACLNGKGLWYRFFCTNFLVP
eukprot:358192-Chlamydomonas_euryale.AAC.14